MSFCKLVNVQYILNLNKQYRNNSITFPYYHLASIWIPYSSFIQAKPSPSTSARAWTAATKACPEPETLAAKAWWAWTTSTTANSTNTCRPVAIREQPCVATNPCRHPRLPMDPMPLPQRMPLLLQPRPRGAVQALVASHQPLVRPPVASYSAWRPVADQAAPPPRNRLLIYPLATAAISIATTLSNSNSRTFHHRRRLRSPRIAAVVLLAAIANKQLHRKCHMNRQRRPQRRKWTPWRRRNITVATRATITNWRIWRAMVTIATPQRSHMIHTLPPIRAWTIRVPRMRNSTRRTARNSRRAPIRISVWAFGQCTPWPTPCIISRYLTKDLSPLRSVHVLYTWNPILAILFPRS